MGWKAWSEGLERWWQGSQWSDTYRTLEAGDDITKADREQAHTGRAQEGSVEVDFGPPPEPSLYESLGDEAAR